MEGARGRAPQEGATRRGWWPEHPEVYPGAWLGRVPSAEDGRGGV